MVKHDTHTGVHDSKNRHDLSCFPDSHEIETIHNLTASAFFVLTIVVKSVSSALLCPTTGDEVFDDPNEFLDVDDVLLGHPVLGEDGG